LGPCRRLAGNLGRPVGEVVGDLERDRDVLDPADLADRAGELPGPAPSLTAEDRLQRLALALVGALVHVDADRRLRLARPDVALERAQRHHVQSVQAHVAVAPLADVPGDDALAVALARSLGERAGTRNRAIANVEPVSGDVPLWNVRHDASQVEERGGSQAAASSASVLTPAARRLRGAARHGAAGARS